MKVSAIVSTYCAERFLRGRIDDLLAQTFYARGELELIVVNAGSRQHEDRIVREYLARGVEITYIYSLREPIYQSWNRAVAIARGEYLTSANADDRLHPAALETLARALDERTDVDVVYADSIVTSTENAVWGGDYKVSNLPPYNGRLAWPDYEPKELLRHCFIGPAPLWRRSLHTRYGMFDATFQLAGDYEWWLRLAANGVNMQHIPDALSLYYDGGNTTMTNRELTQAESRRALLRWRDRLNV
jgi:glycosyltransferase involved in cell wall biosynthesis